MTSFRLFIYGVIWVAVSSAALSCNPAKRALKQKELIDKAIAEWVLNNPIPMSDLVVPGDTTVMRDTTWVPYVTWDTIIDRDTVRLVQVRHKTIREVRTIRDTLVRTVNNTEAIMRLAEEKDILQGRLHAADETKDRMRLWIIILALACLVLTLIHILRR